MSKLKKEDLLKMKEEALALLKENEYRKKVIQKMLDIANADLKKFK
jgi:hypothetical protein